MKRILAPRAQALVAAFFGALVFTTATARAANALPAWNEGPARKSIIECVAKVIKPGSPDFVPVAERIAVFDNDGTVWAEQPMYFQAFFIFDRIKALAPQHPESHSPPCSKETQEVLWQHISRSACSEPFSSSDKK